MAAAIFACCEVSEAFLLNGKPICNAFNVMGSKTSCASHTGFVRFGGSLRSSGIKRARLVGFDTRMKLDLTKADPKDVRVLVAGSTGQILF